MNGHITTTINKKSCKLLQLSSFVTHNKRDEGEERNVKGNLQILFIRYNSTQCVERNNFVLTGKGARENLFLDKQQVK